ncbi:MAG: hypothetical protein KF819_32630 [Labilithrix sp.]|nr:hypothetical protein [Labilithrix sp.]
MNARSSLVLALFVVACGQPAAPPAAAPPVETSAPPPATAPAPAPAPTAEAPPPAADPDAGGVAVVTESVSVASSEAPLPTVANPNRVIAELRPKFNACYTDGLKANPKMEGSVTLSAKLSGGKVTSVTPKLASGLNDKVIKCLSALLMAAEFPGAGAPVALDIPLSFATK